ncbi:MAG: fluoride efflux transporter FluC [Coriobacteriales bacterium]
MTWALTALFGGLGAATRFLVDGAVQRANRTSVPLGTLVINVTGSLLMGLLVGAVWWLGVPDTVRQLLGVGLLGGYTTFSTACVDTVRLAEDGRAPVALAHAVAMLLLSWVGCAAGLAVMHVLAGT